MADLANKAISQREKEGEHLLERASRAANNARAPEAQDDAIWEHLPVKQRSAARAKFDVYLDGFISVVQGGPRERNQMLRKLFLQIDRFFQPNKEADTNCNSCA